MTDKKVLGEATPEETGLEQLGLKFKAPDSNTPGYFALRKQVYNLVAAIINPAATISQIDGVIDFLLGYVEQPENRAGARKILEEQVSRSQYLAMMGALLRSEGEDIFPFGAGNSSATG
jgi:hypothetical protein